MSADAVAINPWMILPFGVLLGMIALAPLFFGAWWLRHYPKVAFSLAAITLAYYFLSLHAADHVWDFAHEYISFIALVGSLYIISGGIHIDIKGEATPAVNVIFLLVGAVLANFLGTTGASMLLIRPWIRMNRHRARAYHIVFFIFTVSNIGGCLTPIGDPPLFLGYLMGIPFWWVAEHCLLVWTTGMAMLLAIFYFIDLKALRQSGAVAAGSAQTKRSFHVNGLPNLFFVAVIIAAVFVNSPPFLREGIMIAAALGSWFTTPKSVHKSNHFDFHPIQEVAILFAGIFATMMPALDWLQDNAGHLENANASFFYWGCGSLSSLLDNAPTYLCFLKAISAKLVDMDTVQQVHHLIQTHGDLSAVTGPHAEQIRQTWQALQKYSSARLAAGTVTLDEVQVAALIGHPGYNLYIVAISVAAVFFGACTYIGNGPNFMVKSIAESQKVPVPSFLDYIFKFTLPFLLPVLVVVWWLFFRG